MYLRLSRLYILLIISLLAHNLAFGQGGGKDSVKIYFKQGYSTLNTSLRNNKESLNRIEDSLKIHFADSLFVLKSISVVGGASPEGNIRLNQRLSIKRANNLFNYLSKTTPLPEQAKTITYLGRDWQGLLKLVENDPDVPHRDDVIELLRDIIARSKDGEKATDKNLERLQRLHNGEPYRYMYRKLFPELRASSLVLYYTFGKHLYPIGAPEMALDPFTLAPKPMYVDVVTEQTSFLMSLKTNLVYDALLIPNVGAEFYLGRNFSTGINTMFGWWKNDKRSWYRRAYGADIYARKWFGEQAKRQPLTGHHAGIYVAAFTHDIAQNGKGEIGGKPGGNIFDKANYSAGVEYGYSVPLTNRLNIDFTVGVGYMWGEYSKYKRIDDCYVWQSTNNRNYIGPTKLEISLSWTFQHVKLGKGVKR